MKNTDQDIPNVRQIDEALQIITDLENIANRAKSVGRGDALAEEVLDQVEMAKEKINVGLGRKDIEPKEVEVTVAWEQYERREGGSSDGTLLSAPQTGVTTVTVPVEYESESWEDDAVDEAIRHKEGIQYIDERIIVNEN